MPKLIGILLFLIIINTYIVQPKKTKTRIDFKINELKKQQTPPPAHQSEDFFINLLFAFFVLPIFLLYAGGEGINDDYQIQILIAIFLWILIIVLYNYFSQIYKPQNKEKRETSLQRRRSQQRQQSLSRRSKIREPSRNYPPQISEKLIDRLRLGELIQKYSEQLKMQRLQMLNKKIWIMSLWKKNNQYRNQELLITCKYKKYAKPTFCYDLIAQNLETKQWMIGHIRFEANGEYITLKNQNIKVKGKLYNESDDQNVLFYGQWMRQGALGTNNFRLTKKM